MLHPKIMIIGSDNYGDLYGSKLATVLLRLRPEITLFGVGGPNMRDAGVRLLYDISDLDHMGVVESLKAGHLVKRLVQRMSASMERFHPDLVIQIGSPVFNLRLIELAKAKEIPVVYYYTPLSGNLDNVNVGRLSKLVDKVLAVTRYELDKCQKADINVEFVGHPLIDLINVSSKRAKTKAELGLSTTLPIVAILPGGRGIEVRTILPVLLRGLKKLKKSRGDIQVVLSLPSVVSEAFVNESIKNSGFAGVKLLNDTHDALSHADAAIVTCGCTSLEAALMKTPSLAVHKVAATSFLLDKMLARKTQFAMVNVILQQAVVPELVQSNLTESRVALEVGKLLSDPDQNKAMLAAFEKLPYELGDPPTIDRAVQGILAMVGQAKDIV